MVAGKAEDLQVPFAIVATLKHRLSVMDLEYALGGRYSADLASAAAGRDQRATAGCGQRLDAGAAIVRRKKAIPGTARPDQWREGVVTTG